MFRKTILLTWTVNVPVSHLSNLLRFSRNANATMFIPNEVQQSVIEFRYGDIYKYTQSVQRKNCQCDKFCSIFDPARWSVGQQSPLHTFRQHTEK